MIILDFLKEIDLADIDHPMDDLTEMNFDFKFLTLFTKSFIRMLTPENWMISPLKALAMMWWNSIWLQEIRSFRKGENVNALTNKLATEPGRRTLDIEGTVAPSRSGHRSCTTHPHERLALRCSRP